MRTPHRQAQHSPNTSALHNPQQQHSTSQTKQSQNNSGLLQPPPLHPQQPGLRTPVMGKAQSNSSGIGITQSGTLPNAVSASNLYASRGGSQSNLAPQVHQRVMTPPLQQNFVVQQ